MLKGDPTTQQLCLLAAGDHLLCVTGSPKREYFETLQGPLLSELELSCRGAVVGCRETRWDCLKELSSLAL